MSRHPLADLRLGLRLMAAAGRSSLARLVLVTVGVGLGVCLLLLVLTAVPALQARQDRTAWQSTTATTMTASQGTGRVDGVWWLANHDYYRGRDVLRVYLAAAEPAAPVPPGLTRLPEPGQIAASPALTRLLAAAPADELGARLPGRVTTTIDPAGLASPDELAAFIGATPDQVQAWGGVQVHAFATRPATIIINGYARIMLIVLASGLLLPVVVFIGMVTRIDAARREQRLAAIRLVGGTNGQVAGITGIETGLAAAVGALAGWLGYLAARPIVVALVTFDGLHFYPADVAVPAVQLVAVLCAVPVAAVIASAVALRRVRVSPLGVTRGASRRSPGRWRLAVPTAGFAGLVAVVALRSAGGATANSGTVEAISAVSLLLVLVGIAVAGVWACVAVARTLARLARRTPALIAARRLAADPQATYRAITGVVLATFVTGMFAGVTPDPNAKVLENSQLRPGVVEILPGGQPAGQITQLVQRLDRAAGVTRILTVRTGGRPGTIAVSCSDLATAINVSCAGGQPVRTPNGLPPRGLAGVSGLTAAKETGPVHALYVFTRDGTAGEDRIRTTTATLLPAAQTGTRTDQVQLDTRQLRELNTGLRTGTAFVMLVAACSLTVAALGALIERRRTFALLRAAGMQLTELRGMVLLETVLPLAVTVVASALLGLATAAAISKASGQPWQPPGLGYPLTTAGALLATIAVTAVTLPLIDITTRPQQVHFT